MQMFLRGTLSGGLLSYVPVLTSCSESSLVSVLSLMAKLV